MSLRLLPRSRRPRNSVSPACLGLVALALGASAGCSGSDAKLAPVTGVVRLDGKPLASGLVTSWPAGGRSASGWIQSDGTFKLGTFGEGDGASIGTHRLTVTGASQTASGPPDYDNDRPAAQSRNTLIPAKYSNPDSSGLSVEVKSGVKNVAELELATK